MAISVVFFSEMVTEQRRACLFFLEVAEEQLERESKAIAAEYQNLKEELTQAEEETKAAIKSVIANWK